MRILKESATAVIIDIQEKLHPHIHEHEILERNTRILIQGLQALEIPLIVTEQYTKGLGKTISGIGEVLASPGRIEKIAFSCCDVPEFMEAVSQTGKKHIILAGEETHVCVLQTALDLLEAGYSPIVVADCVSSRKPFSKQIALKRMEQEGAVLTTYESILFELLRYAGSDTFKMISRLVK